MGMLVSATAEEVLKNMSELKLSMQDFLPRKRGIVSTMYFNLPNVCSAWSFQFKYDAG